jgi:hypothetical protein
MTLDTNDTAVGRTTTSEPDISEYPVGPRTDSMRNHDMYEYDKDPQYWDNYYPPCVLVAVGLRALRSHSTSLSTGQQELPT